MNPEEYRYLEERESSLDNLKRNYDIAQTDNYQKDLAMHDMLNQDTDLAREQLDTSDIMELLEHLIRGDIKKKDDKGNMVWTEPDDKNLIVFTEYGVQSIKNTLYFYINKNTLLSNYDEKTINEKMLDFVKTLNRTIYIESEKMFRQPSDEDCLDALEKKVEYRAKLRKYARELIEPNKQHDLEKIKEEIRSKMENKVEDELYHYKEILMEDKQKRYSIIMRQITDFVHSTYLRALNGVERNTLRKYTHVSENIGFSPIGQQQKGGGFWSLWNKKKY